jgi:hypothetical protein
VRVCLSVTKEWMRETTCVGVSERESVTETAKTEKGIVIKFLIFFSFVLF